MPFYSTASVSDAAPMYCTAFVFETTPHMIRYDIENAILREKLPLLDGTHVPRGLRLQRNAQYSAGPAPETKLNISCTLPGFH
eukprot:4159472-Pyramimonas_sp.AAC.1